MRTCSLPNSPEASACSDLPVPPNTRVSSPSHEPHEPQSEADVMLPHAEPIPPEQKSTADQWIPVSLDKRYVNFLARVLHFNLSI